MTELQFTLFFEITQGALSMAGWWVLFYKLHPPPTLGRRILLLLSFIGGCAFWRLIPLSPLGNALFRSGTPLLFALFSLNLRTSLLTALSYMGAEAIIDRIRAGLMASFTGALLKPPIPGYYALFNLEYLLLLGWTLLYYWIMRNRRRELQAQGKDRIRQSRLMERGLKQAAEIQGEMKNLLFALQTLCRPGNYQGIGASIQGLAAPLNPYEPRAYTAVPVIDGMIAYKKEQMRKSGVNLSVRGEILTVSDSFSCIIASILSIALDNARDGVAGKQALPGTPVHCGIWKHKNLVFIQVSPPPTKALKNPGKDGEQEAGFQGLCRAAERYGGEARIIEGKRGASWQIMLMDPGGSGAFIPPS